MYRQHRTLNDFLRAAIGLLLCCAGAVWAQPTAFTYQGKLTDAGNPANGNYDLQIKLFDTPTVATGVQQGGTLVRNPTVASAGVFTVTLDFGADVFSAADRYLEIGVRPAGSASAYTVLAPRQPITSSPYAIQTINAQQLGGLPASRYLTSDASGNVGIGTTAPVQSLQVNGVTSMGPPGSVYGYLVNGASPGPYPTLGFNTYGPSYLAGVPGYGSVFQYQNGDGRLTYYTGTSNSAGDPHDFTPRFTILRDGSVGIGTTNPASARLQVEGGFGNALYGVSSGGRGVWGESNSWQGVFGKSNSNAGVVGEANLFHGVFGTSHSANNAGIYGTNDANGFGVAGVSVGGRGVDGLSTTSIGVAGKSTSGSGVYGESAAASLTAAGVFGKGTSSGSIGVIGEANINNAVGVFGVSTSSDGVGVYARNLSGGRAMVAEGNVGQSRDKSGWVKAMINVLQDGTILECFNGITNVSTGNCGFVITHPSNGRFTINFNFQVDDRFISVTTWQGALYNTHTSASVQHYQGPSTKLDVVTFITNVTTDGDDAHFTIFVF